MYCFIGVSQTTPLITQQQSLRGSTNPSTKHSQTGVPYGITSAGKTMTIVERCLLEEVARQSDKLDEITPRSSTQFSYVWQKRCRISFDGATSSRFKCFGKILKPVHRVLFRPNCDLLAPNLAGGAIVRAVSVSKLPDASV